MKSVPKATIYLDIRNPLENKKFPVTLRIYFQKKAKFYRIRGKLNEVPGFTQKEFDSIYSRKATTQYKNYKKTFDAAEEKANDIIKKIDFFSFDIFKEKFFSSETVFKESNNIFLYLEVAINESRKNSKFGTASIYNTTKVHLEKFYKKKVLIFHEITPKFLNRFEKWLLTDQGIKSVNTIGIYMRSVRVIYNQAISDKIVDTAYYPFGKSKYQIPKLNKKTLKALTKDEVRLIDQYETENRTLQWVRDIWIFSYLSNGMNIADIVRIESEMIMESSFEFVRKKTKDTAKSNLKSINVAMQPRMVEIIERWGNPTSEKYLFPIIDESMDEEMIDLKIRNLNNLVTKKIKEIAKDCNIEKEVTAVFARHSFATILRDSGASIEYIGEALGHNNITTTMHYLAKFDTGVVKKWSLELL